jgi:transcriptional regulator with PAS, ATPase and Fis domain
LFLDEITEMAAETQSKLLRAIQEHAVRPVGATREIPVDVRLVASTNRDPEEAVRAHFLRQDLYYRLQANVLQVPPLRERLDDVPLLVEHFIALFNQRLGRTIPTEGIDEPALDAMLHYHWPGNVRELANAVEGAMTFGNEELIRFEDLPPSISRIEKLKSPTPKAAQLSSGIGTFADVERDLILRALEACDWNKVHAAAMLKISRKKLYAKINKYQLEGQRVNSPADNGHGR